MKEGKKSKRELEKEADDRIGKNRKNVEWEKRRKRKNVRGIQGHESHRRKRKM